MAGRGNGSKRIGKGGAKRYRKTLQDNIQGITKLSIHRLARRSNVKQVSGLIYEEIRGVIKVFLENVSVFNNKQGITKTLDVISVLKKKGRALYSFGG